MKELIQELVPPDLPPVARWRIAVFLVCSVCILFMAWSISPWGFVLAEDFQKVTSTVKEVRVAQVEQYLFDAKESECSSIASGSNRAREFFSRRILTLNREYFILTGIPMDIPPCQNSLPGNLK